MKKILLIIIAIVCLLQAQTLKEGVEVALSNNATVKAAEFNYSRAQELTKAVYRKQLPTLSLDSSYKYISKVNEVELPMNQTIEMGQHDNYDSGLTFSWLAFNGFGKEANLQLSEYQRESAAIELRQTQKKTAYQTARSYLDLKKAKIQKEVIMTGKERMELQQKKVSSWVNTGMALPLELMTISLSVFDYEQQLVAVEALEQTAQEKLNDLAGTSIIVPTENNIDINNDNLSLDLESNEQLQLLELQKRATLMFRKLKNAANYPELSLNAGWRYAKPGVDPIDNEWMSYTVAGIGVNWLLWDWGGRKADIKSEDGSYNVLLQQESSLRDQLQLNYDNCLREYRTLLKQLEVLKKAVNVARDRMKIFEEQVNNGVVTATDFRDADADLTQYELKLQQQKIDIFSKQLELDYLSGKKIDEWRLK